MLKIFRKKRKGLCLGNVKDGEVFIFGGVRFKRSHPKGTEDDELIGCHIYKTEKAVFIMNHAWVEIEI